MGITNFMLFPHFVDSWRKSIKNLMYSSSYEFIRTASQSFSTHVFTEVLFTPTELLFTSTELLFTPTELLFTSTELLFTCVLLVLSRVHWCSLVFPFVFPLCGVLD